MTKMTALTAALLAISSLSLAACGAAEDGEVEALPGDDIQHIYFEGQEVAERIAEDPDATFFVDLGVGNIVHFEQDQAELDFSRFLVQCPSMPAPVPMDSWLQMMGLSESGSYWNLRSSETVVEFRAAAEEGGGGWGCQEVCDSDGKDCVVRC